MAGRLRDYKLALDERDRLGLNDALPTFSRLRAEAGAAPAKVVRPKRRRQAAKALGVHHSTVHADLADKPPASGGKSAVKAERRGRPPRVQQARALLQEQLGDGPKPGVIVETAAQEAAIPERSLLAATDALGVRCQKGQWRLPG